MQATQSILAAALVLSAGVTAAAPARAEMADEFVSRVNRELTQISIESQAAGWVADTYINGDTELRAVNRGRTCGWPS